MAGEQHPVNGSEFLGASRDKQVSLRLPLAVDQRLDALLVRAHAVGERTSRAELIAALILRCDLGGEDLGSAVRHLRTATVAQAVLDEPAPADNVYRFADKKPGPRRAPAS